MCAESSSSEGRMRLPPPSRRYSAISVMVLTPEAASRPSSCSMATRSSRSRSKTSLAVAIANVLKVLRFPCLIYSRRALLRARGCAAALIRPVVRKLQLQAKVLAAQQGDDRLQHVAVLAGDSALYRPGW